MNTTLHRVVLAGVTALGLSIAAHAARAATVADTLASDPRFSKLVDLIEKAGLTPSLKTAQRITVLAPTNAAFERLPSSVLTDLTPSAGSQSAAPSPDKLQALVRDHLIDGTHDSTEFVGRRVVIGDEAGTQLVIDGTQSGVVTITTMPRAAGGANIGGLASTRSANVVVADIIADNGVIHAIDNVLLQ